MSAWYAIESIGKVFDLQEWLWNDSEVILRNALVGWLGRLVSMCVGLLGVLGGACRKVSAMGKALGTENPRFQA